MPSGSLEQQAMDRVARMYSSFDRRPQNRRTQRNNSDNTDKPEPEKAPQGSEQPLSREEKPQSPPPDILPPEKPVKKGFLETLMKDKDQSLIMLLLVILMKDGADMNLLLALVYMLI